MKGGSRYVTLDAFEDDSVPDGGYLYLYKAKRTKGEPSRVMPATWKKFCTKAEVGVSPVHLAPTLSFLCCFHPHPNGRPACGPRFPSPMQRPAGGAV